MTARRVYVPGGQTDRRTKGASRLHPASGNNNYASGQSVGLVRLYSWDSSGRGLRGEHHLGPAESVSYTTRSSRGRTATHVLVASRPANAILPCQHPSPTLRVVWTYPRVISGEEASLPCRSGCWFTNPIVAMPNEAHTNLPSVSQRRVTRM